MRTLLCITLLFFALNGAAQQTVEYRVTFIGSWVAGDSSSYPADAHFTQLIGATHSPGSAIWVRGELASQGVTNVAELGSTSVIQSELIAAAQVGTTGRVITLSSLFNLPSSTSKKITVNADQSNVTLISMLAPSSDWFVGVSDLRLRPNGQWLQTINVELHPYDAGTEDGEAFTLSNTQSSPITPIALVGNSPFFQAKPIVGQLKFDLLTPIEVPPNQTLNDPTNINIAPVFELLLSD